MSQNAGGMSRNVMDIESRLHDGSKTEAEQEQAGRGTGTHVELGFPDAAFCLGGGGRTGAGRSGTGAIVEGAGSGPGSISKT